MRIYVQMALSRTFRRESDDNPRSGRRASVCQILTTGEIVLDRLRSHKIVT